MMLRSKRLSAFALVCGALALTACGVPEEAPEAEPDEMMPAELPPADEAAVAVIVVPTPEATVSGSLAFLPRAGNLHVELDLEGLEPDVEYRGELRRGMCAEAERMDEPVHTFTFTEADRGDEVTIFGAELFAPGEQTYRVDVIGPAGEAIACGDIPRHAYVR